MGALFGGVMEYNSMYFGFAFLICWRGILVLAWAFSWKAGVRPGCTLVHGQYALDLVVVGRVHLSRRGKVHRSRCEAGEGPIASPVCVESLTRSCVRSASTSPLRGE